MGGLGIERILIERILHQNPIIQPDMHIQPIASMGNRHAVVGCFEEQGFFNMSRA